MKMLSFLKAEVINVNRDDLTYKEVKKRIENQWIDEKKIIQSNYIIKNENLESVKLIVEKIHHQLMLRKYK